jgi:diadenosine tetraphosphate (Ap4A) HIT family hydrolase
MNRRSHSPSGSDPEPFRLDSRLAAESLPILELGLSSLRLVNDARYPWVLLVPRVPGAVEILDLEVPDQLRLWDEIRLVARVMRETTRGAKLNIGALGNQVPQLHVHVVARVPGDDAWPGPVWGVHPPRPYLPADAERRIRALEAAVRG